jgi:hypothetical protein
MIQRLDLEAEELDDRRENETYQSAAAAPKKAYVPGVMQGRSGWHAPSK